MGVNTMSFEQASTLLASLHEQATGKSALTPTDLSDFISVAQSTLQAGYDPVINAISQVVGRTIIAVRPYDRKFRGLEASNDRWGGITRKINFADRPAVDSKVYQLVDGQSVDQYEVRKPKVLQTNYVGSDVYTGFYTIFTTQLDSAFRSPEAFGEFMSGLMEHFSNEREQWLENFTRSAVNNFIAGKIDMEASPSDPAVVHLLTEYNALTGLSLTAQTVRQPANYSPFIKWMYARVGELSDKMAERSELYQAKITGYDIYRHTPVRDQRIYMLSEYLKSFETEVKSDVYNAGYLNIAGVEGVSFWQSIKAPSSIYTTPMEIDTDGSYKEGSAVNKTTVIGVMFDRDAIAYNIFNDSMDTTPMNARGKFYNIFNNMNVRFTNDFTEKGIVLLLD